ncbi:hypothetical protein [Bradyrhizobium sp. SZCCHNRI2010]|uniref:hypothetical protein n=1 Tax=Bradyrhizobium sp. SZCCHNRI2010 TaxID=3057283 RepID=UPI0028EAB982|nr:hypothetical protein [Bradyrhizobium sp. SZCCHNRI2010]
MMHQENLILAIKQSKISKIAVIDDAFDIPEVDNKNAGDLLECLGSEDFQAITIEAQISEAELGEAIAALETTQYGDQGLSRVLEKLYRKFGDSLDERFNPAGMFGDRLPNLTHLAPVMRLLETCNPKPNIVRYGSTLDDLDEAKDVQLIFVDFYLDPSVSAESAPKDKNAAKKKSLVNVTKLVKSLGEKAPSVILMSSAPDVRKQAEKFREEILTEGDGKQKGLVFASRFGFLEKTRLKLLDGGLVGIEDDAADDLLDVFQSYKFGRSMHTALEAWLGSAEKAATSMRHEIEHLHLKDFAYLVRFRLLEEGQSLIEYLEWFFGECLLDAVGKEVDEVSAAQETVKFLNKEGAEQIEGAYEGATKTVADLYHRVRIEGPRKARNGGFRLGDLYTEGKRTILATMTPDCDLIVRKNGKRGAERLLMLTGELKDFDAPETPVADFIMIDGKPRNIKWDMKKILTKEFEGFPEKQGLKYVGTLRPLYAQELQRKVLHDLGRVGVSTAPAIGVNAAISIHVQSKAGPRIKIDLVADCTIMTSRGGNAKATVLFRRGFVPALMNALIALDPDELDPKATANIAALKEQGARKKLEKIYRNGVPCEEMIEFGIYLTASDKLKSKDEKTWCWVLIEMGEKLVTETLAGG